ncbi:MAG TPA: hypothetical protein VEC57_11365 [Candidatus Limnocylindrales bacterium]|nr:hypothetical protein [Candidatus Limnocylindrales bacterium]
MRVQSRFPVAALLACTLIMMSGSPAAAQFDAAELACRAAVAKNGTKLSKTILKTLVGCHKARAKDGALSGTDCNDIAVADAEKGKVAAAEAKLTEALAGASSKCATVGDPSNVLYNECPAPCADSIDDFSDVAACVICLARANAEGFSEETQGTPMSPLSGDSAKCQAAIGKAGSKLYDTVLKDVTKCQATAEKLGEDTVTNCTQTSFPSTKVMDAQDATYSAIADACAFATFSDLDSCGNGNAAVAQCVIDAAIADGQEIVTQFLQLGAGSTTTTESPTTTTEGPTTTTTLPPTESHPQCPDLGQLVLYSQVVDNDFCDDDADCGGEPFFCNLSLNKCSTVTELDSGWTGLAHDSDINNNVLTRARLICAGPPSPGCGQCIVDGIDPSPGNCRCSNNTRTMCDEPFSPDADDCGGATCDCYFGSPFPLSSGGTPACVVNRFSQDVSGTANVDTGQGAITANLRTQVFLSGTTTNPCPLCGGKCSTNTSEPCDRDSDCDLGGTCMQTDTPQDGIRDGLCMEGRNAGQACDINGINSSFPAYTDGGINAGAGYSLDCLPDTGTNVSGAGLSISLTQTSGTDTMDFNVDCDGSAAGTALCPCKTCSNATSQPCNSDSECTGAGACALQTSGTRDCNNNTDCASRNVGTCTQIGRCSQATSLTCTTNADCQNRNVGPCNPPTCSSNGASATLPKPNDCTGGVCNDVGGGEGECATGPDTGYCDGVTKANGDGILTCDDNADCAPDAVGIDAGDCSIFKRRECFLDPIVAQGAADTQFPVGAAAFCIPPTSSPAINSVAGLPGPGRVRNQAASATFCASDNNVQYQPGVGGCPAP